MAQTKIDKAARSASIKRDKIFKKMEYNRAYPESARAEMAARTARKLRVEEEKGKKKLLPLELASLCEKDRHAYQIAVALQSTEKKQEKPRKAANWEYQTNLQTMEETKAAKIRDEKLSALDKALEAQRKKWSQKYPGTSEAPAPQSAIDAYHKAQEAEDRRIASVKEALEQKDAQKLAAIEKKCSDDNAKLQKTFDAANQEVARRSKMSREEFGRENLLAIRNLKMYFSGIKAVDDVSFDVKEGEIFGLIGPNGAGKTTLFNCITQFYKPTAGNIYYADRFGNVVNLEDFEATDVIGMGLSRTFQNIELVYFLNVMDNLLVGAHSQYNAGLLEQLVHTRKLRSEEEILRRKATYILEKLGILAYKDSFPLGLPYGILKKIELARTLMSDPRCIILDEPAAGLNDAETEDLAQTIRTIRDEFNCSILLVEHDMNLVMSICDTICAISFGKMLAIGTPEEIQNSPAVQEAYLGSE